MKLKIDRSISECAFLFQQDAELRSARNLERKVHWHLLLEPNTVLSSREKLYFHLKNYLPGFSEYGLLMALSAFSADARRKTDIAALKKHIHIFKKKKHVHLRQGQNHHDVPRDEEVKLGDGTLFIEAVESENDSGDEDVTDNEVTFED
ncbi:hypothetical protein OUZ56_012933 [Daphnia magna]|uniref:Uncharacterized protein n=1 Tax=Daphnia magna TaxID=35525 RepID=A0ABQ9Z4G0_9CRUS|nr:hypothetical protein OUZ56_012933 [Daphnia magna]